MTHDVLMWPFKPGETVIDRKFLVKDVVAIGGMGRIYEVEQLALERTCVLKILDPRLHPVQIREPDARKLLENEAKTLSLLSANSDAFVTVFDRGTVMVSHPARPRDGQPSKNIDLDLPYYVMEFLQGSNFEQLIELHRKCHSLMPWSIIVKLGVQAARALALAHAKDIIHRDIKPNNIFLQQRVDGKCVVKFIDFGVSTKHGAPGIIGTGTRRYGAPELLLQGGLRLPENKQSDIYPFGLVLYELAILMSPFRVRRSDEYPHAHIHVPPPLLSAHRAGAPPALVKLVDATLAKRPEDRPTAEEVVKALEAIGADDASADAKISELVHAVRDRPARKMRARTGSQGEANKALTAPGLEAAPAQSGEFLDDADSTAAPHRSDAFLTDAIGASSELSIPAGTNRTAPSGVTPVVILDAPTPAPSSPSLVSTSPGEPASRVLEARAATTRPVHRMLFLNDTAPDGPPLFDSQSRAPVVPSRATSGGAPRAADDTVGALALTEEADIPVYSSMAGVFEGWEHTHYRSSPFDEVEPRPKPVSRPKFEPIPVPELESVARGGHDPEAATDTESSSRREPRAPSVDVPDRSASTPPDPSIAAFALRRPRVAAVARYVAGVVLVAAIVALAGVAALRGMGVRKDPASIATREPRSLPQPSVTAAVAAQAPQPTPSAESAAQARPVGSSAATDAVSTAPSL